VALCRIYSDDFEQLPAAHSRFVDRAFGRENRVGHIVADYHSIGAAPRLEFAEESPNRTIDRRGYDEVRRRPEHEDVVDLVAAVFDRSHQIRRGYGDDEI